jgi:hypothetical protein
MCCGTKSHHTSWGWGHHQGGSCGCGGPSSGLLFATREEKTTWLEQYLEGLREEVTAVEERLAKLKAEA